MGGRAPVGERRPVIGAGGVLQEERPGDGLRQRQVPQGGVLFQLHGVRRRAVHGDPRRHLQQGDPPEGDEPGHRRVCRRPAGRTVPPGGGQLRRQGRQPAGPLRAPGVHGRLRQKVRGLRRVFPDLRPTGLPDPSDLLPVSRQDGPGDLRVREGLLPGGAAAQAEDRREHRRRKGVPSFSVHGAPSRPRSVLCVYSDRSGGKMQARRRGKWATPGCGRGKTAERPCPCRAEAPRVTCSAG